MKRALIAAAVGMPLLIATAGASWWFLIREDAHLATRPPAIPAELLQGATPTVNSMAPGSPSTAADPTQANNVLAFQINPDASEAAYFVNEELASVGIPSTAKGATKQISGAFYLTADGTSLAPGTTSMFTVDLRSVTSDKSMRDQRVQQALETSRYPTATFTVTSVSGYNPAIVEGAEQSLQLTGLLDLHGVQKQVTWEVKAYRKASVISALATLPVSFADFNITAPRFGGLVSIDDKATLQVQLIAQLA